jgi:rhodanese-related sulfurtransferase
MFRAFALFFLLLAPVCGFAHIDSEHNPHSEVTGDQLKNWYDKNKPLVVIDARGKPYFDQNILPNAKWIPHDASESDINNAIPSKTTVVVLYCSGNECPASGFLYDRLNSLGYSNVYEYRGGIKDWIRRGYPTVRAPLPKETAEQASPN